MTEEHTSQEPEITYNSFNIGVLVEADSSTFHYTQLPVGLTYYIPRDTMEALNNLRNLLLQQKLALRLHFDKLEEEALEHSYVTGQIELLTQIMSQLNVKG